MLLFLLLGQNLLVSGAIGDSIYTALNPAKPGDTIILFEENFNDGDFTNNPAWTPAVSQICAPEPAMIEVVDGVLRIYQKDARSCGTYASIVIELDIPVSDNTRIQFDVKPSYSTVDEGAGWTNREYPVTIILSLVNLKDEFLTIYFCYNYRGGESYYYKDHIRHVFPYCAQDVWIRNEVYRVKDFFPDAKTIVRFQIEGRGWDYESYADNIKIFDSKRIIGAKSSDEPALETIDLDNAGKSRHDKAIENYRKNLRLATFTGDTISQIAWLCYIGEKHFQLLNYDSAMIYLKNAVIACKKNVNPSIYPFQTNSYIKISKIYSIRNEYDSALLMLDTLSGIYQNANDTAGITFAHNERAGIYYLSGDIEKAVQCYREVLKLNKTPENTILVARTFQNLGDLYLHDNKYQIALESYLKAHTINMKIGDLNSVAVLLLDIGNVYFIMNKYDDAIENLNKSLESAKMRNLGSLLSDIYLKLSEIYLRKGDTALYYQYYSKYSTSKRLIINKDQTLAEQYVKYETEKIDQENKMLRKDNEIKELKIKQKSYQFYLSIAIGGLALILVVIIYGRYRAKQKANLLLAKQKEQLEKFNTELIAKNDLISGQKQEIEKRVEEKETMLRELHHRVKNNLQVIYSMLSLQADKIKDKYARAAVESNINRIWAMALVHHKLYLDEHLTKINMPQYIDELSANILETNTKTGQLVNTRYDIKNIELEADIAIPLGLIINELLSNALKHAFKKVSAPEIKIQLMEESNHNLVLSIKDNGTGMPENIDPNMPGVFGLELINMLVRQLKGELKITNQNGACFKLTIPTPVITHVDSLQT